jgi:predicted permease
MISAPLRRFLVRLRSTLLPNRAEAEMTRELSAHLDLIEADLRRRGISPDEARAAAKRAFGGLEQVKERHRDAHALWWLDNLRRDVQYATRTLSRSWTFTGIVVATLALGIGANTAIFSVVHSVLLSPLPYKDASRLMRVWENVPADEMFNHRAQRYGAMDVRDLLTMAPRARTLTYLTTYGLVRPTTILEGSTVRFDGASVSVNMFEMLGATAALGRTFAPDEGAAGLEHVLVLSDDAWQRFGADAGIIGRLVTFGGDPTNPMLRGVALDTPYTVIGVMPPDFHFPYSGTQFWVPRVLTPPTNGRPLRLETVARLADGATPQMAASEMEVIRRDLAPANVASESSRPRYELIPIQEELIGPVRPALLILIAAVGIVLLIACVNVANLLLARAGTREREIALRTAVGAGRARIVQQLLTESLVLAGLGGLAGIVCSFVGVRLFRVLSTPLGRSDLAISASFPRLSEVRVDGAVLAYAIGISLLTALIFGLMPAVRASRAGQSNSLRAVRTSNRSGFHNTLIVAEISLATLLLVAGGLLIHSFLRLSAVDPGFDSTHLLTFQVIGPDRSGPDAQRQRSETITERLRTIPSVQAAAYARQLPMVQLQDSTSLTIRRNNADEILTAPDIRFVSRDYLETLRIPVIAGRGFSERDGKGDPGVILINEAMAKRDFANGSPLGTRVTLGRPPQATTLEIVGVIGNVRQFGLDRAPQPQVFLDYRQVTSNGWVPPPLFPVGAYHLVRTTADTSVALQAIRTVVRQVDAHASIDSVATMDAIVQNSILRPRLYAVLLGVFAGVAVALAAIGLYGAIAYAVTQRTREIGIRMALGATRGRIIGLVLRRSMTLMLIGLLVGLAGAAALSHYLEGLLFGLTPLDPATYLAVALLFTGVGIVASCVPAVRAATIAPWRTIRAE